MKKFFGKNIRLCFGLIISIIIIVGYIFTEKSPEKFVHAGVIFYTFYELGLAYIASFIFYIIVVYAPEERKRRMATLQFKYPIINHLGTLTSIYIASIDSENACKFNNVGEFLVSDSYTKEIKNLDFKYKVYKGGKLTWMTHIPKQFDEFKESINSILNKYGSIFEPEVLDSCEGLVNSSLLNYFNYGLMIDLKDVYYPNGVYTYFDKAKEIIEAHNKLFIQLVNYYNEYASVEQMINVSQENWNKIYKGIEFGGSRKKDSETLITNKNCTN